MNKTMKIILGVFIVLILAVGGYYLLTQTSKTDKEKQDEKDAKTDSKVVERVLTKTEQEFFTEYFINNPGFTSNFYETVKDLSIPMILEVGQGSTRTKTLTKEEKLKIIETDLTSAENYDYLVENPDSAFNLIIEGKLARDLFEDKTGDKYHNDKETILWEYNKEYDVYYNQAGYGLEGSFANYYEFGKATIIEDTNYQIPYTAYYHPEAETPNVNPDFKEKIRSGHITLKKISNTKYYFVSNISDIQ